MTDTTPGVNRIAATNPAWATVVDRDSGRCTCTGECGKSHRDKTAKRKSVPATDGELRCKALQNQAPLLVAPRDPATPIELAVRLVSTELCTWCDPCLKGATNRAVNARTKARKQALEDANVSIW